MYRGARIPIPIGLNGFNGDDFPNETFLVKANNIIIKDNKVEKIGGTIKFDSTAVSGSPSSIGATTWEPVVDTQRIITVWDDGAIYRELSGDIDDTTITTYSTTVTAPAVFVKAGQESTTDNKKLLIFNKGNEPIYIDGDAETSSSITASADWSGSAQPPGATFHDFRSVAWLDNTLYFSPLDDHTDFSVAGGAKVHQVSGGPDSLEIRSCFSWFQNRLFIFWNRGISYVDTTDIATATVLNSIQVSATIGIAGPKAITQVGNDIWFLDQNGKIRALSAVESASDVRDSDIGAQLRLNTWLEQFVSRKRLEFSELFYDDNSQILYIAVTSKTAITNDLVILINLQDRENPRITFDNRGTYFSSLFLRRDKSGVDKVFAAGGDGFVRELNRADRSIDGATAYTGEFRTAETDFGYANAQLANAEKRTAYLELIVQGTNEANITVQPYIDGLQWGSGFTLSLAGSNDGETTRSLGDSPGFSLGPTADDAQSVTRTRHMVPMRSRGQRYSFEISNGGTDENFRILEAYIWLSAAGVGGEN